MKKFFENWLENQKIKTIDFDGFNWFQPSIGVLQSYPFYLKISPEENSLAWLFKNHRLIALKYSTNVENLEGLISYHVIYEGTSFDFEKLSKKVRHDVKRGMDYAKIEPITFRALANDGWNLRSDTIKRQGRDNAEKKSWWFNLCLSAEGLEGFETWAAISNNKLVASLIAFTDFDDGCCSILYQQSATYALKSGVNNALAFEFINNVLSRKGIDRIFYGLHSLDAPPSVDEFKFRMGFSAYPVRQRVVFNKSVKFLANPYSYQIIKIFSRLFSGNSKFSKLEGLLRFYLQGKLPLELQEWPKALLPQKTQILESINKN